MAEEERKQEETVEESRAPEDETPETGETAAENETSEETAEPEKEASPENEFKEERHFWKKKEKKKDERDEQIASLTDRLQRLMAEFDNYRKRTEKEKAQMFDMGTTATVEKLLPVVDNFERGLQSIPEDQRKNAAYTGMDMIYKQLVKALTDLGVEPIEAEGKPFDPEFHNAVMQVENDELTPGTVAAELQKGYTYKGSVIRHSMVSVVQES